MSKQLSDRQERFVLEYLVDLNGAQAAIRAGYSEKGAKANACRLLTYDSVKQALSKEKGAIRLRLEGSVDQSVKDYEEARQLAIRIKQPAAAVSAIRWRDGLFGLQTGDKTGEQQVIIIAPARPASRPVDAVITDKGENHE